MPPSSSLPISPIDLRLNQDVLSLILDHFFHIHEPQTPQSTLVSPDPGAVHLLLVSKAFSSLVLPRLWNTIVLRSSENWTLLFGKDGGALVGDEHAARRALVKTLHVDFGVNCSLKKPTEPAGDRLLVEVSFQQLPSIKTVVLLSPESPVSIETLISDIGAFIEHRVQGFVASRGEDTADEGGYRGQIFQEVHEGVYSEIGYDQIDLMSSSSGYDVVADICDPVFNDLSATTSSNPFDPSFLSVLRQREATLQLHPGRQVLDGGQRARGYKSLKEEVLPSLRRLLLLKDLPRMRLVGFPLPWVEEFTEWRDSQEVSLGRSRGCEWVLEDGTSVSFLPDEGSTVADDPGAALATLFSSMPMFANMMGL